jgi:hypothetical protein
VWYKGRAPAGAAGDTTDTGSVEGCGQAHRREDGREAARQHQLARARRPQK